MFLVIKFYLYFQIYINNIHFNFSQIFYPKILCHHLHIRIYYDIVDCSRENSLYIFKLLINTMVLNRNNTRAPCIKPIAELIKPMVERIRPIMVLRRIRPMAIIRITPIMVVRRIRPMAIIRITSIMVLRRIRPMAIK